MLFSNTEDTLTVSNLNLYIKTCLENDPVLSDFWVQGEISSIKAYPAKNMVYLTLSDGQSQINAVIFENYFSRLKFIPMQGQTVRAKGRIGVFHKKGTYSLQIFTMTEVGEGLLSQEFEKLKLRLAQEGLFDPERKKQLPPYPSKIGLITPKNSAAYTDFVTIKEKFFPFIQLYLIPATVQGETAIPSLLEALDIADLTPKLDVVVMLRGGGSSEDLAYFNDEALVRRVANFTHPLISAIGHEIDYTLTDFASDLRAATPSVAAHVIAAPFIQVKEQIKVGLNRSKNCIETQFEQYQSFIESDLDTAKQKVDHQVQLTEEKMGHLQRLAVSLNPLHKLSQGFSICTDFLSKTTIKSVRDISSDQELQIYVSDGTIHSRVLTTHDN